MKNVKDLNLNTEAVALIEEEVRRAAENILDLADSTSGIQPEIKKLIAVSIAAVAAKNCQAIY